MFVCLFSVREAPLLWAWTFLHARSDEAATKLLLSCTQVGGIKDSLCLTSLPSPISKGSGGRFAPRPFVFLSMGVRTLVRHKKS